MRGIISPLDGFGRGGPFGPVTDTVNRPTITVPGAQAVLLSAAPLVFASSISVSDAVESSLDITLTFTGGTITLDGTTGLSFSVGDGTADATMTFSGTITNINNALSGMSVTAGSTGDRTLAIVATNTTASRSANVAVQFGSVPVNTVAPAITGDTDTYGNLLTCSTGTFTGYPAPTLTYQWQRDGSNISGATSSTYTTVLADDLTAITCEVTGTNAYGSDMEETAAVNIGALVAPILTWTTLNTDNTPGFDIDFSSPQVGDQVYMVRNGGTPSTSDAAEITSISPINTLTFLWGGVEEWPDDTYDTYVYFVRGAETSGNSNTVSVEIATGGGDVTAPVLTSPTATSTATTTATGGVTTDEGNGTLYFVVTTSATPPSAAQVKAGQNNTGSAAVDSGSQAVSGTGVQSISGGFTGLSAATNYYVYYMHEDASANQSTVASASVFRTHFTILTNTVVDLDYQNDQAYVNGTYYASIAAARTAGVIVQTSSIDRVATSNWSYTNPCTIIGTGVIAASLGSTAEYLWTLDDGADGSPTDELAAVSLADVPPNTASFFVFDGGSQQINIQTTTGVSDGSTFKSAVRLATNNCAASYNGGSAILDTSVTLPTVTQLVVGNRDDGTRPWNGTVRRIQILNETSSDANLATYST